jgi:hypothetical protein
MMSALRGLQCSIEDAHEEDLLADSIHRPPVVRPDRRDYPNAASVSDSRSFADHETMQLSFRRFLDLILR